MHYRTLAFFLVSLMCRPCEAQQGCAVDGLGRVICALPGGGAAQDSLGRVETGLGQCVQDDLGRVMCSALPGGGAAVDGLGRAVCSGGCVSGQ